MTMVIDQIDDGWHCNKPCLLLHKWLRLHQVCFQILWICFEKNNIRNWWLLALHLNLAYYTKCDDWWLHDYYKLKYFNSLETTNSYLTEVKGWTKLMDVNIV
jgi:hypothetical protein